MKRLILFFALSFISFGAKSTDLLGGEITWKCVVESGVSKYKFKLIIYANCGLSTTTSGDFLYLSVCNTNTNISQFYNNATMPGTSENIVNSNGKILVKKISTTKVIPNCSYPTLTTFTCAETGSFSYTKVLYESAAIDFHGINPPQVNNPIIFNFNTPGRYFATNSNAIVNHLVIAAKMYPYFNKESVVANSIQQCFDSSPDFSESPIPYIYSNGLDYTINNSGFDIDNDDLSHGFSNPIVSIVNNSGAHTCPEYLVDVDVWNNYPSYNKDNPFGLSTSDFHLDSITGEYTFKTSILGEYVMVPTITSFKNGQKVAEVSRDFIWNLFVDGTTSNINRAPIIMKPFVNTVGAKVSIKNIVAGESINIPIVIRDSIVGGGISPHEVQFTVNGIAMGVANADTVLGCPFPNCAVLSKKKQPTPYSQVNNPIPELMQNTSVQLNGYGYNLGAAYGLMSPDTVWLYWKTDFSNLNLSGGVAKHKQYNFSITAKDNFCVPKSSSSIFSVNVVSPNFIKSPKITCIDFIASANSIEVNWEPTFGDISTFVRYDIYRNKTLLHSSTNAKLIKFIDNSSGANIDSTYYVRAINTYGFMDKVEPVKRLQLLSHSDDSLCVGMPANIVIDTIMGGRKPYAGIHILGDDGLNISVTPDVKNISYAFSTTGMKKYTIVITDSAGCIFEKYDSLFVRKLPTAKIVSDLACKSSIVNFTLAEHLNSDLDSIWWRGDYDSNTQSYLFDRQGKATDFTIMNPKWIFSSNNGIGKFPVSARLKNIYGCINYVYDTVQIGLPSIDLLDPSVCCNPLDTITFTTKYLNKPYTSINWIDNSSGTILLSGVDKFPVSLLSGRTSINLKVQLEDAKGCEAEQVKNYILMTGIVGNKSSSISIHPNPTTSKFIITGLPENEVNDIFIFDVLGKQVLSHKVQGKAEIDLNGLSTGVYFLRVGETVRSIIKN